VYLTEAYLQSAIGTSEVAEYCPTAGELATTIELAEAEVEAALRVGGYTALVPPSTFAVIGDVPPAVKLAAVRSWLILAHDRRGIPIEKDTRDEWRRPILDLREGLIEIDSTVDTTRAPGGMSFTPSTSTDGSPTREPVFSGERMGDF
jgi:hypothetical protein